MRFRSITSVLAAVVLCSSAGVPAALGQTAADELAAAAKLFSAGEYVKAQEALLKVNADALSDEAVQRRHRLVDRVKVAINLSQKAASDMADADQALEVGRLADADADYKLVLENPYAAAGLKKAAQQGRQRVGEKRRPRPTSRSQPRLFPPSGLLPQVRPASKNTAPPMRNSRNGYQSVK